eukprot:CAMPEP_0178412360 /NCGR_PEP_ID=MMETSP0689_2-20121128/21976_1 /TAXON_ID=160604 /ORGANISM="Amphidinium massartii, Strain CS-259" /LENGTH=415 /DNA_ID=CAMNT_0020033607 /DNA_START=67 /DNA_END=1311 /DNA_ORIENTATION=-
MDQSEHKEATPEETRVQPAFLPQRLFRLHISEDGRTIELRPYISIGQVCRSNSRSNNAVAGAEVHPPSSTAPKLTRLTTAEIDEHEDSYFQADEAIDVADRYDVLCGSSSSGPSRRATPLRRNEFEHGYRPPPALPGKSHWPILITKLLRKHGYWVDYEAAQTSRHAKTSKTTEVVSVRQAKRWEERHNAPAERERRWEERKVELYTLRQARRARREAAKKAARDEFASKVRKVRREARLHWQHPWDFDDDDHRIIFEWQQITGPVDLQYPPGIDRNEAMAARLGLDGDTYRALQELQNRDIRPEDYDLLGRLDENIQKATLDGCQLKLFPTELFKAEAPSSPLESCGVCLVDFQDGEELRTLLPCKHRFHRDCIDYWLLERSTTCPMCLADVKDALPEEMRAGPEMTTSTSSAE